MNYIIWVNIYLVAFYGFYWIFLRKETFFQLNRVYLLGGAVLPFIIPFLDLKEYFLSSESSLHSVLTSFEVKVSQVVQIPRTINNSEVDSAGLSILIYVYMLGCFLSFIGLAYRLMVIKRKMYKGKGGEAFSFFNSIYVDPNLEGYSKIVEHEQIHAREKHSLDVLIVEIIKVVNWFNPVVYFLNNSIKLNHEFIADEISVSKEKDHISYAELLLSQAMGTSIYSLSNNFFNEPFIKNRIIMLVKNKSKKAVLRRFILLIPILVGLISLQSKGPSLPGEILPVEEFKIPEVNKSDNIAAYDHGAQVDDKPQVKVDILPEPEGGVKSLLNYIAKDFKQPKGLIKAGNSGRIVLVFDVERDGSLTNIRSVRDLGPKTAEEAIRLLKSGPKWKPAIHNGITVKTDYTLPIVIKLY